MRRFIIGMMVMAIILITGCKQELEEKITVEEHLPKIGISFDTLVVERWQRDMEILVGTLTEMGAEVDVQLANEDKNKQIEQVRYLIDQKVDVLIIIPNDAYALTTVIDEAQKAGIKVISYDRLIRNAEVDLYISFDNVGIGEDLADRLLKGLSDEVKLNLMIINGDPKDYNSTMLNEGFYNILTPLIEEGLVEIIEEDWAPEWREQYARDAVERSLNQGKTVDGIIAANDVLAMGAIETLSKWQLAGDVKVVSQDAELSACQRIVEGSQLASVYKPISDLAVATAKAAYKMANNEKVESSFTIDNGLMAVPYLKLKASVVDRENMQSLIIDSGFHRKEDVYLNINQP